MGHIDVLSPSSLFPTSLYFWKTYLALVLFDALAYRLSSGVQRLSSRPHSIFVHTKDHITSREADHPLDLSQFPPMVPWRGL